MKGRALGCVLCLSVLLLLAAKDTLAQVYGYTNEKGVLILSNVPSDPRMRLIAEGSRDEASQVWRYTGQYDSLILKAASLARLDSALVKAVIAVESGFNRFARSRRGAMGLMQLMPETARRHRVSNPYDPWQNLRAGSTHLRGLLDEFKELRLALAAYNAGATSVRRHRDIPPYRETRDYVRRVMAIYGAGSRISIAKGGRVYSIDRPGGRPRIRPSPAAASNKEGRSLADVTSGKSVTPAAVAPLPGSAVRPNDATGAVQAAEGANPAETALHSGGSLSSRSSDGDDIERSPMASDSYSEPLYYRYKDPSGVIYITRRKPTQPDYEVLRP
ncbi:MAG: lytic transglycosylase domain-containing protein [Acidobacteriota bacterium]